MPKWYEHICTESVSPILLLHVTVYCRGQPCWKLREAISTWGSFSWSIVYCCSLGFKLNSCMILLGFKMSYPESAEDTVQINILAPRYSLWDHDHLIFYCWEVGLKYPLFLWPELVVITTLYQALMVNVLMILSTYCMLFHHNWSFYVSAQSFKEFSQLLNMVEEERRRLVRCFYYFFIF